YVGLGLGARTRVRNRQSVAAHAHEPHAPADAQVLRAWRRLAAGLVARALRSRSAAADRTQSPRVAQAHPPDRAPVRDRTDVLISARFRRTSPHRTRGRAAPRRRPPSP